MVQRGIANSRVKDFFDVWFLSKQFDFNGPTLQTAVQNTFIKRNTTMSREFDQFIYNFTRQPDKDAQWKAFVDNSQNNLIPTDFASIAEDLCLFLSELLTTTHSNLPFIKKWPSSGVWC